MNMFFATNIFKRKIENITSRIEKNSEHKNVWF